MTDFYSIQLADETFVRIISRAYARQLVIAEGITEDDFRTGPDTAIRDFNGYTFKLKGAPGAKAMVSNAGSVILKF